MGTNGLLPVMAEEKRGVIGWDGIFLERCPKPEAWWEGTERWHSQVKELGGNFKLLEDMGKGMGSQNNTQFWIRKQQSTTLQGC